MKNAIVIALTLVSVSAFAGSKMTAEQKACVKTAKMNKELKGAAKKEAIAACKAAPAAEAKMETAAPATK
ncbi:MAG: hypothetical protein Q7U04_17165 [Bacteriovorax sp.]|nr:hypothetical protein [Bacteriovorax sp.]